MLRSIICSLFAFMLISPCPRSERDRTHELLNQPIPVELNFTNTPFSEVLDQFVTITHTRLNIRWDVLNAAKIHRDSPVIARLKDVKASKYLGTVLNDVGGGEVMVTYLVEPDGAILITTADDAFATHTQTRIYEINDLVDDPNPSVRAAKVKELIENLDVGPEHPWREPDRSPAAAGYGAHEWHGILFVCTYAERQERIPLDLENLRRAHSRASLR
jgi:hypothetical protein